MSDFKGFRFGNIHIKDLHLTVVSSGDRFNKSLLPEPTDYSVDVPGGNGKYYFGQTHNSRTMSVKTAFDNLDEYTIRKIRQIFATDKLKDLVFDEEPYKVYRAKLSRAPAFNYVCFLNKETNQRVYKGECDFDFVMYHPYAFCFNKYIVRAADYYKCTPPESIIKPSEDTYAINNPVPPLNKTIKEHYNTINNMGTPWKGGYPTIE
jgi:phage-related protein